MKRNIFTAFFLMILCFVGSMGFAEYPELTGREMQLNGPFCWERLGVALNEKLCDDLIYTSRKHDKKEFTTILESYDVLRVMKGTKVFVQDVEIFKGMARVTIMTGIYKGMSGWVPLEWLKENESGNFLKDNSSTDNT